MSEIEEAGADQGLWFINSRVEIALSQADNADGISVLKHRVPPGDAPPLHVHQEEDEIFIILEGEMRFSVGGKTLVGRAGETLYAPGGVPHGYRVTSPEGARFHTITRGGFERLVRAFSRSAENAGLPAFSLPSPEAQKMLAEACAAAGIEILGPPID